MKKLFFIVFILILYLNIISGAFAIENTHHCDCCTCNKLAEPQKEVKDGTKLTIQDCISIGLKNSPYIKQKKYELDIAKSNVGIAKSAYFPTLQAGVGYGQVNNSNNEYFYSLYRELPHVGVSLNKMIWDFGRTRAKIKMEEFYKLAAEYEFMDSICSTVFDIKIKYYNLLKAQSLLDAEKTNTEMVSSIADTLKLNNNKGELQNIKTEQMHARNNLIEAENNVKNAFCDLNNSIYFINAPKYTVSETQTYNNKYILDNNLKLVSHKKNKNISTQISKDTTIFKNPHFELQEAIDIAYKNSPDLKVLIATERAMEQALLVIKRSYYPELNADVGYNFVNAKRYANNDLTIGVNLTASLNAQELNYSLKGGQAQINLANTEIDKFKKNLYFTVSKALNNVEKSEREIPVAKQRLSSATENFNLAIQNYKNKKVNHLELLNAHTAYYNALQYYIDSIYHYNISLIDLEISMHYHLLDIHDKTEHAIKYHDDDITNNLDKIFKCKKHHKK